MTWPEYYDSVMRKASKRGATVIWINPPEVRKIDRSKPPAKVTPAASVRVER